MQLRTNFWSTDAFQFLSGLGGSAPLAIGGVSSLSAQSIMYN